MSIIMYKQRFKAVNKKTTPSKNYAHIRYIATRHGAVKNEESTHGLFGKLNVGEMQHFEKWQDVANVVREHSLRQKNVYRGIISVSPKIAEYLKLNDKESWESYVEDKIKIIAKENNIKVENLAYCGAFHDEKDHPHVHIVFWDKQQKIATNFIHPKKVDHMRTELIKDTFKDELLELYKHKDVISKKTSEITNAMVNDFSDYITKIVYKDPKNIYRINRAMEDELEETFEGGETKNSIFTEKQVEALIPKFSALCIQLPKSGRLYYSFLDQDAKESVLDFVEELKTIIPELEKLCDEYARVRLVNKAFYGEGKSGKDKDIINIDQKPNKDDMESYSKDYLPNEEDLMKIKEEFDKVIANKVLRVCKELLSKEKELLKLARQEQYYKDLLMDFTMELFMFIARSIKEESIGADEKSFYNSDMSVQARNDYFASKDMGESR